MIAASVEFYDVVLFVHITSVVLAFGPPFAYGAFFGAAMRTSPQAVATVGRGVLSWDRGPGALAMVLILASGLYLAGEEPWDYGDFFISWGLAAILVLFALVHAVILPATKRLVEATDAGADAESHADTPRLRRVGGLTLLIVLLTIYVMTAKPFL